MEDTYTIMRVFAGSWGLLFMFVVFVVIVVFALRPGTRRMHQDIANIPFRHDDKPARPDAADSQGSYISEVRQ